MSISSPYLRLSKTLQHNIYLLLNTHDKWDNPEQNIILQI
jgi:hypothetical protein